ncbi:hypothetical protein HRI_002675500 [Hibiscus trionum]|uniref:RNase H type-1 domain-containing protein n=1 Tax=Hibiscus trionum TaxID=183268 RepID=A0A9W7M500_HIBTR|nr:hypothetical protein HRI_002675500 [Hibiscus trionum]
MRALVWIQVSKNGHLDVWDGWWDNPLSCLEFLTLGSKPAPQSVKFCLDGFARSTISSCGGILCNDNDIVRAIFFGPSEGIGVVAAVLLAFKTLDIFIQAGWIGHGELVIVTRLREVVSWFTSALLRPRIWWSFLASIDQSIYIIGRVKFQYSPGNGNSNTTLLALDGASRKEMFQA